MLGQGVWIIFLSEIALFSKISRTFAPAFGSLHLLEADVGSADND